MASKVPPRADLQDCLAIIPYPSQKLIRRLYLAATIARFVKVGQPRPTLANFASVGAVLRHVAKEIVSKRVPLSWQIAADITYERQICGHLYGHLSEILGTIVGTFGVSSLDSKKRELICEKRNHASPDWIR